MLSVICPSCYTGDGVTPTERHQHCIHVTKDTHTATVVVLRKG